MRNSDWNMGSPCGGRQALKLRVLAAMSRLLAPVLALGLMLAPGHAHEVRPAIADLTLGPDQATIELRMAVEGLLSGIDLSAVTDTSQAEGAARYDALRALPPQALRTEIEAAWPALAAKMRLHAGAGAQDLALVAAEVPEIGNLELPRDTILRLSAELPADASPVTFGWSAEFGVLVLRQTGVPEAEAYNAYLTGGQDSAPIARTGGNADSAMTVFLRYIPIGFDHIIPKGIDHILFVLGLFFFSLRLRPLVYQVSAFTLAHTITLAAAILGWVSVPASVVEPLIAASIAYVAIENILFTEFKPWRPVVVFGFGLLHGLGFASVLTDFGLDPSRMIAGLIGFNLGVELGQLTVIAVAWFGLAMWLGKKPWWRARVAIPASVAIAVVGSYWAVERVLGA